MLPLPFALSISRPCSLLSFSSSFTPPLSYLFFTPPFTFDSSTGTPRHSMGDWEKEKPSKVSTHLQTTSSCPPPPPAPPPPIPAAGSSPLINRTVGLCPLGWFLYTERSTVATNFFFPSQFGARVLSFSSLPMRSRKGA